MKGKYWEEYLCRDESVTPVVISSISGVYYFHSLFTISW